MPVVEPLATPPAEAVDPAPRPRTGLVRYTAVVATVAVVVALVGVGLLVLPVSTPAVDCGTAFGYLYDGRYDQPIDPADPPEGTSRAEAEANNDEPCHDRVVDRARPGSLLIAGGTLVALVVLGAEVVARTLDRRRRPPGAAPTAG